MQHIFVTVNLGPAPVFALFQLNLAQPPGCDPVAPRPSEILTMAALSVVTVPRDQMAKVTKVTFLGHQVAKVTMVTFPSHQVAKVTMVTFLSHQVAAPLPGRLSSRSLNAPAQRNAQRRRR